MSYNPWQHIDELKVRHEQELAATTNELESLKAVRNSLTVNDDGQWVCRYVPAGERKQEHLRATSAAGLVAALKAVRAREEARRKEALKVPA